MTLTEQKTAVFLWSKGRDTCDIAQNLSAHGAIVSEAEIYQLVTNHVTSKMEFIRKVGGKSS